MNFLAVTTCIPECDNTYLSIAAVSVRQWCAEIHKAASTQPTETMYMYHVSHDTTCSHSCDILTKAILYTFVSIYCALYTVLRLYY